MGGSWPKLEVSRFGEDDVAPPTYGTNLAASGVANTKGAYTTVVASLPFDISGLLVAFQLDANVGYLVDIAVGGAGSEVVKFPNLAMLAPGLTTHTMQMRFIPLRVQAGQRLAMRFQATVATPTATRVKVQLLADSFAGIESPQRWEDWGTNLAASTGTVVTGGAANVKGAFSQLVASSAFDARLVLITLLTGTIDDMAIDFARGTDVKLSNIGTTNEFRGLWAVLPWIIPAASQVQARLAAAGGASTCTLIAYGGG